MQRLILVSAALVLSTAPFPSLIPAVAQQTPAAESRTYVSTARMNSLLREDLGAIAGKEAVVYSVELAPGWVGERHYHTGDVFVYVQEGRFVVDVDG